MYRVACIKEFEIILEQSGKLLRWSLQPYSHSNQDVDLLVFKYVFRNAVLLDLITASSCERWLQYRDSRNSTANDYGENFAEETFVILLQFITDGNDYVSAIQKQNGN